jgi:hypothetical protein
MVAKNDGSLEKETVSRSSLDFAICLQDDDH